MSKSRWSLENVLVWALALPVLGILMGGVYSVPAMYLTNSREPFYTLLLAVGPSTTVIGFGTAFEIPYQAILVALAVSLTLLCARRWVGPLDHNLERFGMVHAFTLLGMAWVVLIFKF